MFFDGVGMLNNSSRGGVGGEEERKGEGLVRHICSCCCLVADAEGVVGEGSNSYWVVYQQVVFCELCGGMQ